MTELFAERALLADGWARDVLITWDEGGHITGLRPGADPGRAPRAPGPILPGMTNLHGHAFQRAMAGRAETRGPSHAGEDSFWTWRETMYDLALALQPEDARIIARHLAIECLKRGYTALCEFHYLHHDTDGHAYADPAEMSLATVGGLRESGIAVTHLPVLYARGGFGEAPLGDRQRRFHTTPETILEIVRRTAARHGTDPLVRVGLAPHSLRAAPVEMIAEAVDGLDDIDDAAPIHIHVAEQEKEVADCLATHGARPVSWLLDRVAVDGRWCLVHATHLDGSETRALAARGAVAGLCPTTEANLGDGLFPLLPYREAGGAIGIGSDSHVSRDPARELALLEYGIRLTERRRNRATDMDTPSVGGTLWRAAAAGGAQAAGADAGAIALGRRADLIALDGAHPDITERDGDAILDGWIFAADETPVDSVWVAGRWVVGEGRHALEGEAATAYRRCLARLFAAA
ncbi:formimidoylglutamate deiminase [Marivibrio halodurans]|uniref:Formimidoylglutamate deiminase n=1 Tax=Marivibrio halodurans TaxID=2039722 RepID=A0A8J7S970_9PROT|nr:formimidoylglutamate deiminase [Marivibrio halodurans]MBP5857767.1 formimidoylglutamate deiminase [Marivibrio halodurans]